MKLGMSPAVVLKPGQLREKGVKSGHWATEVRDLAQRKICCLCLPVA